MTSFVAVAMEMAMPVASIAIIVTGLVAVLAACVALSFFLFVQIIKWLRVYKDFRIFVIQKARQKWLANRLMRQEEGSRDERR